MRIQSFSVRPTNLDEMHLPYVTSSMVEAIVTCPRWGIVHSVLNKRFTTNYRQLALEAGSLMHEIFAVFNLHQIATEQKLVDHAVYHGEQLFPQGRFVAFEFKQYLNSDIPSQRQLEKLVYKVIGTSDYYDDPNDKNRTLANLEHCGVQLAEYYLMNHSAFPIWISDENNPEKEIGIEKSVDVIFNVTFDNGYQKYLRFIGLLDVLYRRDNGPVKFGEYKTTSSMNDGWMEQFRTRHQQTAYFGALHAYFDNVSEEIIMTGSTIPVRKTTVSVQHFEIERNFDQVKEFLKTALFAMDQIEQFKSDPLATPMFTHSCNRYFRPCSLMDLCTAAPEDQLILLDQMQVTTELSPSEMKAFFRQE